MTTARPVRRETYHPCCDHCCHCAPDHNQMVWIEARQQLMHLYPCDHCQLLCPHCEQAADEHHAPCDEDQHHWCCCRCWT